MFSFCRFKLDDSAKVVCIILVLCIKFVKPLNLFFSFKRMCAHRSGGTRIPVSFSAFAGCWHVSFPMQEE